MTSGERPLGALNGIRVIDLSERASAAWCARLLADYGADVTLIEPPGGVELRREAPFDARGDSVLASHLLANKRSLVLDIADAADRSAITGLLDDADILVASSVGAFDALGVRLDAIEARWPRLIVVVVTPHGLDGGREDRPGNDLTAWAESGWASVFGMQSREPLKGSGRSGSYIAGAAAYGAAVTALCARDRDGLGQIVDVAESEGIGTGFGPYVLRAQHTALVPQRRGDDPFPGPLPVRDGYFVLSFSRDHFWRDAMNVLGLPEYAENPRLNTPQDRDARRDEYSPGVQAKLLGRDRAELFETFGTLRIVGGPVMEPSELIDNAHLQDRGFFVRPEDDPETAPSVGAPVKLSATPWSLRTSMPAHEGGS